MAPIKEGRDFYLFRNVQTAYGALFLFLLNEYWIISWRVKRPGSEAERSPLSSAEVKNEWSYSYITSRTPTWREEGQHTIYCQPNFH